MPAVDQLLNINILKDVLVPMAAAGVAVWLALKKFKKERLWQEKYAAYQEILASVESLIFWAEQAAAQSVMMPTLQGVGAESLNDDYSRAKRRLSKHATIGRLLLSAEAVQAVDDLNGDLYREDYRANEEHPDSPFEEDVVFHQHAKQVAEITAKHLPKIIEHARRDLEA